MKLITISLYVKDWLNFGHLHTKKNKNHNQIYVTSTIKFGNIPTHTTFKWLC